MATIDDAINAINLDKINAKSENSGKTKYIEDLHDELINLRDLILKMKIIKISKDDVSDGND